MSASIYNNVLTVNFMRIQCWLIRRKPRASPLRARSGTERRTVRYLGVGGVEVALRDLVLHHLLLRDALVLHLVAAAHVAEVAVLVAQHPDPQDAVLAFFRKRHN